MYKSLNINKEYEISKCGKIRHKKTKKEVEYKITPDGYKVAYIKSEDNSYPKRRVHRLVVEHFTDIDIKNKEINHIDGNKLNNHLDNLEVVQHRQNMIHARDNGLLSNNRWFKVKDLESNTTKDYPSLLEFCKETNLNKLTIVPKILDSVTKPIANKYSFINPPEDIDSIINSGGKKAKKLCMVNNNGVSKIFNSISSVSYSLKIPHSTLITGLKNKNQYSIKNYTISYVNEDIV